MSYRDPIDPAPPADCAACRRQLGAKATYNVTRSFDVLCDGCAARLDPLEVRWRVGRADAARMLRRWP